MSEVDDRYVRRGFWVNVEQGPIMGSTITTDIETATFIIALLALLSSLAINRLWNLLLFACHQFRATGLPSDGLFWQQQMLLRAELPPTSLFADWLKLWWLWRGRNNALKRTLPHTVLAVIFMAGGIAAGIFSSYVVSTTNLQVLVENPLCSPIDSGPGLSNWSDTLGGVGLYKREVLSRSQAYASSCWQNSTSLPGSCSIYVQPNIPVAAQPAHCLFDPKICIENNQSWISIDSGLVDTNMIFGWNLVPSDRIKFRSKVSCGVLQTEGYEEIINASDYPVKSWHEPLPGEEIIVAHYGSPPGGAIWKNVTWVHSLMKANFSQIYSRGAFVTHTDQKWDVPPASRLPEMNNSSADVMVIQIRKDAILYSHPVDDLVFSAHRNKSRVDMNTGNTIVQYLSDWPDSVIGCLQQYQFCFALPNSKVFCTDLTALPADFDDAHFPGISDIQRAALRLLAHGSFLFDVTDASAYLQASKILQDGYIENLPDDQWIQEVIGWQKFIWACLQSFVTDYAVGYGTKNSGMPNYTKKELSVGEKQLCSAQRMRKSGGFVNINVFGLSLIIAFSVVVSLVDLVFLRFTISLQSFRRAMSPRIHRWIQDGAFQLQRKAYQAYGEGDWKRLDYEIPQVSSGLLSELPLELHPVQMVSAMEEKMQDLERVDS